MKKHPFASYNTAKHPDASNLRLQTYNKNQWTFLITTTRGVDFSSRNNFPNLGSSAKAFIPVKIYNSSILKGFTFINNTDTEIKIISVFFQCDRAENYSKTTKKYLCN